MSHRFRFQRHRGLSPRSIIELHLAVIIGCVLLRTWVVQGLVIPVQVESGSMAPALRGFHQRVECGDCRFPFVIGNDQLSGDGRAICPNCGWVKGSERLTRRGSGDRVVVERLTPDAREIRRFDVIAFHQPGREQRIMVKRVIGLPGEQIAISDGDLLVDGRLIKKSLPQLRRVAVPVHDDAYRPAARSQAEQRWRPNQQDSGWESTDSTYKYEIVPGGSPDAEAAAIHSGQRPEETLDPPARHETPARRLKSLLTPPGSAAQNAGHPERTSPGQAGRRGERRPSPGPVGPSGQTADWLTYHHTSHHPGLGFARTHESAVTDAYAYDQRPPSRIHVVGDLLLSGRIEASEDAVVLLRGHDGYADHVIRLDRNRGRVALLSDSPKVATADLPGGFEFELALVDRQVMLAIDGQTVLREDVDHDRGRLRPTPRPFSIAVEQGRVEVTGLRILRDLFYLQPRGNDGWWQLPAPLAEDAYFVLGDNAPVSFDGRYFPGHAVRRGAILGRVFRLGWPR